MALFSLQIPDLYEHMMKSRELQLGEPGEVGELPGELVVAQVPHGHGQGVGCSKQRHRGLSTSTER